MDVSIGNTTLATNDAAHELVRRRAIGTVASCRACVTAWRVAEDDITFVIIPMAGPAWVSVRCPTCGTITELTADRMRRPSLWMRVRSLFS